MKPHVTIATLIALTMTVGCTTQPQSSTAATPAPVTTATVATATTSITPQNVAQTLSQLATADVAKALAVATKANEQDGMQCFAFIQKVLPTLPAPTAMGVGSGPTILADIETIYVGGNSTLFADLRHNCAAWALGVRDKALADRQGTVQGVVSLILQKIGFTSGS